MFQVGQKVVCVDDACPAGRRWNENPPLCRGLIYTIGRILIDDDGDLIVHLIELPRSKRSRLQWGNLVGFAARRFRPLIEHKTDISIFTRMLTPKRALTSA